MTNPETNMTNDVPNDVQDVVSEMLSLLRPDEKQARVKLRVIEVLRECLPKLPALRDLDSRIAAAQTRATESEQASEARVAAAISRAAEAEAVADARVEMAHSRIEAAERLAAERERKSAEQGEVLARHEARLAELRRDLGVVQA